RIQAAISTAIGFSVSVAIGLFDVRIQIACRPLSAILHPFRRDFWVFRNVRRTGRATQTYSGSLLGTFEGEDLRVEGTLAGTTSERNGFPYRIALQSGNLTAGGAAAWTLEFRQDGVAGVGTVTIAAGGLTRVPN
ncbi:MAG: hypothetical protein ACREMY_10730, partial [bacterium]